MSRVMKMFILVVNVNARCTQNVRMASISAQLVKTEAKVLKFYFSSTFNTSHATQTFLRASNSSTKEETPAKYQRNQKLGSYAIYSTQTMDVLYYLVLGDRT